MGPPHRIKYSKYLQYSQESYMASFFYLLWFVCRLAHTAQGQYGDAKQSFEKALEFDPNNDSYKKNLEVAEKKMEEQAVSINV